MRCWNNLHRVRSILKDLQEFFDDFIQLDGGYRHRNVSLHKGIAFFRTRNIKRKDKTTLYLTFPQLGKKVNRIWDVSFSI
jgi:hypothetical protein